MKIEDQLVGLTASKRLQELGVRRKGFWSHLPMPEGASIMRTDIAERYNDSVTAYSVAELGEMLRYFGASWYSIVQSKGWMCLYNESDGREHWEFADTEADARAKMLIWLIENGHVNVEEINGEGE